MRVIIEALGLVGVIKETTRFRLLLPNLAQPERLPLPQSLNIKPHHARLLFRNASNIGGTFPISKVFTAYSCSGDDTWSALELGGYDIDFTSLTTPLDPSSYELARLQYILLCLGGDVQQNVGAMFTNSLPLEPEARERLAARANISHGTVTVQERGVYRFRYLNGVSFKLHQSVSFQSDTGSRLVISLNSLDGAVSHTLELEGVDPLYVRIENNEPRGTLNQRCGGSGHFDFAGHYVLLDQPGILFPQFPYPLNLSGGAPGGDAQCSPLGLKP